MRGGTYQRRVFDLQRVISIHPPLAGRDETRGSPPANAEISIHPPLAGRDGHVRHGPGGRNISIHPPLAGRDLSGIACGYAHKNFNPPAPRGAGPPHWRPSGPSGNFNPPAPCGAGLVDNHYLRTDRRFQSTRPLRGRTRGRRACMPALTFQSTRPLRGGTWRSPRDRGLPRNFNPPAPCGAGLFPA